MRARVIVIGGGAAGLASAAQLARRADVVLVEARDRLGGRIDTRTDRVLGVPLEHGAEFVHGRPERTVALARRAGARIREIPERHARRSGGRPTHEAAESFAAAQEILALGTRDDEPFEAILRKVRRQRRFSDTAVAMAREFVHGFYLADPRVASSLALAKFTRALEEIGGDVTCRVDAGYARVLDPLVRTMRRAGVDVRLSTRVVEIAWRSGHVEVRTRGLAGTHVADAPDAAHVVDWTRDPLAGGGYAVFNVGTAGASAALASSVARTLFFAGEATAGGLAGTVEGALRSGERAARELSRGD